MGRFLATGLELSPTWRLDNSVNSEIA